MFDKIKISQDEEGAGAVGDFLRAEKLRGILGKQKLQIDVERLDPEALSDLVTTLKLENASMKSLNLTVRSLIDKAVLLSFFEALGENRSLESLYLDLCLHNDNEIANALTGAIDQNRTLKYLRLDEMTLGVMGPQSLIDLAKISCKKDALTIKFEIYEDEDEDDITQIYKLIIILKGEINKADNPREVNANVLPVKIRSAFDRLLPGMELSSEALQRKLDELEISEPEYIQQMLSEINRAMEAHFALLRLLGVPIPQPEAPEEGPQP